MLCGRWLLMVNGEAYPQEDPWLCRRQRQRRRKKGIICTNLQMKNVLPSGATHYFEIYFR